MNKFVRAVLAWTLSVATYAALAAPILLTLDPVPEKVHPPENVFVSLSISGLQPPFDHHLLAAVDLTLRYDPTVLSFNQALSSAPGPPSQTAPLGDPRPSAPSGQEALLVLDHSTPGFIRFLEVSLLGTSELRTLQDPFGGAFPLFTFGFFAFNGGVPATNVSILSDGAPGPGGIAVNLTLGNTSGELLPELSNSGDPVIGPDGRPISATIGRSLATIRIAEPGTFALVAFVLVLNHSVGRRKNLGNSAS